MSDAVDRAFQELRLEYLASLPGRMDELRADLAARRAGDLAASSALKARLHRIAGSAGSYGFAQLTSLAREAERWLTDHLASAEVDQLERIIERLGEAAVEAGKQGSGDAGK